MADTKTPGGTVALPTELDVLQEREKVLSAEVDRLEKMDANKLSHGGHDLAEVKKRTAAQLAEIRQAIKEAKK